ncbi:MAG: hypothetical protein WCG55_00190 [bacterium]
MVSVTEQIQAVCDKAVEELRILGKERRMIIREYIKELEAKKMQNVHDELNDLLK